MLLSDLIRRLESMQEEHGDIHVLVPSEHTGMYVRLSYVGEGNHSFVDDTIVVSGTQYVECNEDDGDYEFFVVLG